MEKDNHTAPLPDQRAVEPHVDDVAPPDVQIQPSAKHTYPGQEPYAPGSKKLPKNINAKLEQLEQVRCDDNQQALTTSLGVKIANNQNTLSAGVRGPSLLEDFIFRDKMIHFDRERIPERVVHARGAGVHGYFELYQSQQRYTKANFLNDTSVKTPVFVRFSTVQGSRGSADTARDVRGFATKFYTQEGNFDIVGVDTPSFFIQDGMKFPDFVHAIKPEPINEVPQAQSAHDSFWDYVSLQPETLQNVMVVMSDRGIPRSYSNIEGFAIHTYKLINQQGESHFVRFHWKPLAGACSLLWDEAQVIMGRDPDFHRKNLWESVEAGDYPEFELGLQIFTQAEADQFDFDYLDATKFIPEALVPVQKVGKMVLNRNPDNYFAETEQVAFCPSNIVPGIDFSDDPMLQTRAFSYTDTQLHRLGGANFNQIPINRPVCPFHHHLQDGYSQTQISTNPANYEPNSINNNWPREAPQASSAGGFDTYPQPVQGEKVRQRSDTYVNFYAQPRLFWLSQTEVEQQHIIAAFSFELSKVGRPYIRERVVDLLTRVDTELAKAVAKNLGITLSQVQQSRAMPQHINGLKTDPSLSLYARGAMPVTARKVAILAADGVCGESVNAIKQAFMHAHVYPMLLAPHMGMINTQQGEQLKVDGTIEGNPSVLVDAVIVPSGNGNIDTLLADGNARYYLLQAYKHLKAIGLQADAKKLFERDQLNIDEGVLITDDAAKLAQQLLDKMTFHRVWAREAHVAEVPA
ncbi:catalase HPII [Utexia brackfieldae]|uniref:catalase HPII n=1 Tax=Utexia brackfieldae TaxID=3074108 RepID=UPI00370D7DBD